jgi:hypothetical protein
VDAVGDVPPQQFLMEDEFIEVIPVPLENLYETIQGISLSTEKECSTKHSCVF